MQCSSIDEDVKKASLDIEAKYESWKIPSESEKVENVQIMQWI